MNHQNDTPSMSRKIFTMNLPVETVSLYLLCTGLADNGATISTKNIQNIWNGTSESLELGLKDLEKRNILVNIMSDRKGNTVYKLIDANDWKSF